MRDKVILICLAGVFAIATGFMVGGRYQTSAALQGAIIRTDRFTGEVVVCDGETCWRMLYAAAPVTAEPPQYR